MTGCCVCLACVGSEVRTDGRAERVAKFCLREHKEKCTIQTIHPLATPKQRKPSAPIPIAKTSQPTNPTSHHPLILYTISMLAAAAGVAIAAWRSRHHVP